MFRVYAASSGGRAGRPGSRGASASSPTQKAPPQKVSLREVAVEQLRRIEEDGAFSGLVSGSKIGEIDADLDSVFSGKYDGDEIPIPTSSREDGTPAVAYGGMLALTNPSDRRMVTEIVSGCTRYRKKLDYIIGRLTNRDVQEIDPPLRLLLRVGLYELMALGTPDHVINEHVDVAKKVAPKKPYAAGFVNGTLRSAVREGLTSPPSATSSPSAEPQDRASSNDAASSTTPSRRPAHPNALELLRIKGRTEAEALSLTHSHPTWMVERWLASLGPEATLNLMQHNNRRPRYSLRKVGASLPMASLLAQLEKAGVKAVPSKYLPGDFVTVEAGLQSALPLVRQGFAAVQDESAGLVVAMLDPQEGETICDACAAPGGKALYTADLVGPNGTVFALDINRRRVEAIDNFATTLGLEDRVVCAQADLLQLGRPGRLKELTGGAMSGFDKLLLDVPCSGLGVLGKRADLRWRRSEQQMQELVKLQAQMLRSAAMLIKKGGVLVYSTCSPDPGETVDQIRVFLRENPDFQVDPPPASVPKEVLTEEGFLLTLPHVHGVDGAFAARMRRVM